MNETGLEHNKKPYGAMERCFRDTIEAYTRRNVDHIDIYPDPYVKGTYAVQAMLTHPDRKEPYRIAQFLFYDVDKSKFGPDYIVEMNSQVEEVQFTCWPPVPDKYHK